MADWVTCSGRLTTRYVGFDTDETAYADADDVAGVLVHRVLIIRLEGIE